eukprot:TRINITY_DN2460_c0_g1_i2.p1 TRINITY_DN2460_c0_g1~~TRINITY_DN2460_c0_g1_i2.p1  ORF type:complete len:595 (+),score=75.64 TRINITY_DN2460_c0_g1_i2:73-1857(+)
MSSNGERAHQWLADRWAARMDVEQQVPSLLARRQQPEWCVRYLTRSMTKDQKEVKFYSVGIVEKIELDQNQTVVLWVYDGLRVQDVAKRTLSASPFKRDEVRQELLDYVVRSMLNSETWQLDQGRYTVEVKDGWGMLYQQVDGQDREYLGHFDKAQASIIQSVHYLTVTTTPMNWNVPMPAEASLFRKLSRMFDSVGIAHNLLQFVRQQSPAHEGQRRKESGCSNSLAPQPVSQHASMRPTSRGGVPGHTQTMTPPSQPTNSHSAVIPAHINGRAQAPKHEAVDPGVYNFVSAYYGGAGSDIEDAPAKAAPKQMRSVSRPRSRSRSRSRSQSPATREEQRRHHDPMRSTFENHKSTSAAPVRQHLSTALPQRMTSARPKSPISAPGQPRKGSMSLNHSMERMQRVAGNVEVLGDVLSPRGPSPSQSPVHKSTERGTLEANLRRFGFEEHTVKGDGNCQFRSLAWHMYNDEEQHEKVRADVISQLKWRRELYEPFVDGCTYDEYLSKMAKTSSWGDHVSLQAAADKFCVLLHVVTSHASDGSTEPKRGGTLLRIRPRGPNGDVDPVATYWVSYLEECFLEHYNPISRTGPAGKSQ